MENIQIEMRQITCVTCGVTYFVPAELDRQRREDGLSFTCPSGHKNCYVDTEVDRLKNKLNNAEAALLAEQNTSNWLEYENKRLHRRITSLRGVITKLKREAKGE